MQSLELLQVWMYSSWKICPYSTHMQNLALLRPYIVGLAIFFNPSPTLDFFRLIHYSLNGDQNVGLNMVVMLFLGVTTV